MTSTPWRRIASHTTSAPMRVRLRGRADWNILARASSTARAAALPAPGRWPSRACRAADCPTVRSAGAAARSLFVIRIVSSVLCFVPRSPLPGDRSSKRKPPAAPGEGPVGASWSSALAVVPPLPFRLPPGAADKGEDPEPDEAQDAGEGYVDETGRGQLDGHAAALGRHHDGGETAAPILFAQWSAPEWSPHRRRP